MLRRFTHLTLTACLALLVTGAAVPSPQEETEKRPKDQKEYELINSSFSETDAAKKLQFLDQWTKDYPKTAFDIERLQHYMRAYQGANQPAKAVGVAKDLLKTKAGDFEAQATISGLTPLLGKSDAATLSDGESAAKALVGGGIDKQFQAANKPQQVSAQQWNDAKKQIQTSAHQTLGWIAIQRKDHKGAEVEIIKALKLNPNSGQLSYWLGTEVLAQGDPSKNELALFSLARASTYSGPGALPPEGRQQVAEYVAKVYASYAGSEEGLAELKETAKTQALPPAGLKIEDGATRAFKAEQKSRKENPLLWRFLDLKATLLGPQGGGIWGDLNGKLTPEMRMFVVSANPPNRPQTINLSSKQGGAVELVLNLENRLRTAVGAGRQVTFEGVASGLTKEPFKLTLKDGKLK
jgi:hypothetical protein